MTPGPHGVTVRTYRPCDLDACRALWTELVERHREIYGDPTIGGTEPGLYFDRHLARAGAEHVFVAEVSGSLTPIHSPGGRGERLRKRTIVGLTGLLATEEGPEVEPVVVARGHRGAGIGRALVEHAMAAARAAGARFLSVRPVARNVDAIRFFRRSGFRTLGRVEMFVDLGGPPRRWQPAPRVLSEEFDC